MIEHFRSRRVQAAAYALGFVVMFCSVIILRGQLITAEAHSRAGDAERARIREDQQQLRNWVDDAIKEGRDERREILKAIRRVEAKLGEGR